MKNKVKRNFRATLFVADLHPDVTEWVLYDKLKHHGNVLSIRVCCDSVTNRSLGYAYITYQTNAEAKSAMDNLNFEDIYGRPCRIMWYQRDPAARRSGVGNIIVKNLNPKITTRQVNDRFGNFGEISSCKVQTYRNGVSKGFAFVNFIREDDAEKAIAALNGRTISGKTLSISKFVPRTQRNCFIKNFGANFTNLSLTNYFESCGEIDSAKVMVDEYGNSKGFGFVCFSAPEEAARAITEMNGKIVDGKPLYVALAQKKKDRVAHLRSQFQQRVHQPQPAVFSEGMMNVMMNPNAQIDLSSTSTIANADPVEAKQLLGEKIYPLVSKIVGDMTGKITGMFLELDEAELLYMIENENALRTKIDEALLVLLAHKRGDGEAP